MIGEPDFNLNPVNQNPESQALPTPAGDLYLRFVTPAGDEFALPAAGIGEVLSSGSDQLTPVPNSSRLVLGLLTRRGRVIWVVDAGELLGAVVSQAQSEPVSLNPNRAELPVIVIEAQDLMVGLAVEQVKGTEWLEPDRLQRLPQSPGQPIPCLQGEWVDPVSGQTLRLLNVEGLLQSLQAVTGAVV
jgi:twitching motility protein PilI